MILKNRVKLFFSLFLLVILGCANAEKQPEQLLLSKNIVLHYEQPDNISHSWRTLILKYPDWYFSHEVVDPKTMYAGIDLTGLLQDYIRSIFDPEAREALPAGWLEELAREQSAAFGIKDGNAALMEKGFGSLYHMFNKEEGRGEIFILEENQAHWLQVHSSKEQFQDLIENIKER